MKLLPKLSLVACATLLATSAQAAVEYDISGTWSFTINGHNYTNIQMDLVGIGTGAQHSVDISTPNGPLTLEEYDLTSLFGYTSSFTVNFGGSYSFETTLYQPGVSAVAFGDAGANESIFATTIDVVYDGTTIPFSANGVDPLSSDEVTTALGNQFEITASSNVVFSTSTVSVSNVPEPASWALMGLGLGLAGMALRRRPHGDHQPA